MNINAKFAPCIYLEINLYTIILKIKLTGHENSKN